VNVRLRQDRCFKRGDDVRRRRRFDEFDGFNIADIMIVTAIAPGPAARYLQNGEFLARKQLGRNRRFS
jgi:hypothetical protein